MGGKRQRVERTTTAAGAKDASTNEVVVEEQEQEEEKDNGRVIKKSKLLEKEEEEEEEEVLKEKIRFEVELEFIQSLANPYYCHFLAQRQYFENEKILAYLEYLRYWQTPDYAKFITYPVALKILDMILENKSNFREDLKNYNIVENIHSQIFYNWLHMKR